jgi:hypothetical protein
MEDFVQIGKDAVEFRDSPRGRFLMAQALYYGIQKLAEVDGVMREVSNICNMKYLLDTLYPGYEDIFKHVDQQRCTLENGSEVHDHSSDPNHEEQNILNVIQYLSKDSK